VTYRPDALINELKFHPMLSPKELHETSWRLNKRPFEFNLGTATTPEPQSGSERMQAFNVEPV
jgi:hypothetical protein